VRRGGGVDAAGEGAVVVLPFANMSGDPEQEYFAGGMVEEAIGTRPRLK
jgi:TolB-like protein